MKFRLCPHRPVAILFLFFTILIPNTNFAHLSSETFNAFEESIEKCIQALKDGDLSEASIWVQKAKNQARANKNPAWKVRSGKLDKKIKRYYEPYFEKIREARSLQENQQFKEAVLQLEKAEKIISGSSAIDLDEAREVDRKLSDEIQQRIATAESQRKKSYQDFILSGQRKIQLDDPTSALQDFELAKAQMFKERGEYEQTRIEYNITKAQYKIHIQEGDEYFGQNDFAKAHEAYKTAKSVSPESMDVDNRLRKAESELYHAFIKEGDQFFSKRDYESSSEAYQKALEVMDGPEAQKRIEGHYNTFKESGDRFLKQEGYDDALTNYQWAQLFMDSPEIKVMINQAENSKAYTENFEKGEELAEQEKLKAARRKFKKAARYAETTEVLEQLNYIRNYNEHIRAGKKLMKKSPEDARSHFESAKALFDTREVSQLMSKVGSSSKSSSGKSEFTTKGGGKFY